MRRIEAGKANIGKKLPQSNFDYSYSSNKKCNPSGNKKKAINIEPKLQLNQWKRLAENALNLCIWIILVKT